MGKERHTKIGPWCVLCVFSSHSFWTSSSLDVPAGVTQEEGHTEFLIHLLSAVRALIFLAKRIQPFLSLVDREVEFCVITIQSFSRKRGTFCPIRVRSRRPLKIPWTCFILTPGRTRNRIRDDDNNLSLGNRNHLKLGTEPES